MTSFLFKFSTTLTNQTPAFNALTNEIRQGFNALYPSFGNALVQLIDDQLPATPITAPIDVGLFSGQGGSPPDTGTMGTTYVWGEFGPVPDPNSPDPENPIFIQISTPGFWADLICDLSGTTVDPIYFVDTLNERWSRGNSSKRTTTPEQQAVNGGKTEVDLVDTGSPTVFLSSPEFPKHGYAGVDNRPLSGTPEPEPEPEVNREGKGKRNGI